MSLSGTVARQLLLRWLLPVATGATLTLAYPPFKSGQLAWVALVPLLFALENCRPGEAFRRGYIAGLAFFGATVWWIIHVTLPGMVMLVAFLALYFGAAAAFFAAVNTGTDAVRRNLVIAVVSSAGWVTLEWMRGKFLFGGFGWNGLGVTQHEAVPLIQFASVTGGYGVSTLVCFVNFAFFQTVRRFVRNIGAGTPARRLSWEFYVATLLVCGAFMYGLRQMRQSRPSETTSHSLRIAMVQADIPQTLKFEPEQKPMILDRYETLTRKAMALRPDLIIWPETAAPQPLRYDRESWRLVTNLAAQADAYLLTGTIDVLPFSLPQASFNSAFLVRRDGALAGVYHKVHLVPFGEYIPLRRLSTPLLRRLGPKGYDVTEGYGFEAGTEFTVFEVKQLRFATVICFEDTLPDVYRKFVQRGVDFMVNLTNDAWFKTSPAAEMHLANAVFRCAETRRPLVRCTNNGVTCIVDQFGFVNPKTRLPAFSDGSLNCDLAVPPSGPMTFYTRHGDVFVAGCVVIAGISLLVLKSRP